LAIEPMPAVPNQSTGDMPERYDAAADQPMQETRTVRRLLRPLAPARSSERCRTVMARFLGDRELFALPVVDASGKPVALVDRRQFIEFFSKPFAMEVFGPRSIHSLLVHMDYESREPVVVEHSRSVEDAAKIIIDAGMQHMVTGFMVTDQGRYLGIANGHDLLRMITQRNEIVLKESEARARSIVDVGFDGVMTHDQGVILDANLRFAQLFGYDSAAELIGLQGFDILFGPETRESMRARGADGAISKPLELVGRRRDGTTFVGETQSCESLYFGKKVRTVAMRDLTERKRAEAERARLEAQLRESQKMEALGTMAGGVAHDFNNALAAILGNAELARQDVGPCHPALVSLDEIGKAGRRAKDLVQQILSFSRRQKLERKATSLALVVVETARLVRATLPAAVSLTVNCERDSPAVLADVTQVNQILLNLCGNALQALQETGRPGAIEIDLRSHVQAAQEAHDGLCPGRYACLTVRDSGPGMDAATRSRIFEPFFTTKPVGKGTGLGLAVVHGIVQAHDAFIDVQSVPGVGTTFQILFPAIDPPAEEAVVPSSDAVQASGAGKRVLYVDDEEAIVFLMERLLERRGYRVSGYTDPREALVALRADPGQFDLAVTDFNMPGMSGLDLARALKEIRVDLPVVLASGYITDELRQKAPAAGVCELIYKPNTADELCEAVARFAHAQGETQILPDQLHLL
jgi:PAS domain S-box-containing protein